jgi:enoyl-CoA hydratase/carnithine racemase
MATAVTCRVQDTVGWIRLDGADRLNSISTKTYTQLAETIDHLEKQRSVRALLVHGAGRVFSAGADIEEIRGFAGRREFEAFIHGFTDALDVIAASRLPVIAAVHGAALGGGLELALACDLRVATRDAKLGLPEAKLGVLPGACGTQRLPRLFPHGVAMEMLMLGTPISGERAYALGLVNWFSEPGTPLEAAAELAGELAAGSAQVPAAAKSLLRSTLHLSVHDGIEQERAVVADLSTPPMAGRDSPRSSRSVPRSFSASRCMDPRLPPEAEAFRAEIRAFLTEHLPDGWTGVGALYTDEAAEFTEHWRAFSRSVAIWPRTGRSVIAVAGCRSFSRLSSQKNSRKRVCRPTAPTSASR